jgi:hypothetical protein
MAARNVRVRKPPEKFIPSMQGNKYEIALAQITASLGKSKNALAFAQGIRYCCSAGTLFCYLFCEVWLFSARQKIHDVERIFVVEKLCMCMCFLS